MVVGKELQASVTDKGLFSFFPFREKLAQNPSVIVAVAQDYNL